MSYSMFPDFSEEKMAAFIDGMLSPEEMASFQDEVNNNPLMLEFLDEVKNDVLEPSASATDDYPGLLAKDTIGGIIPLIQESLDNGLSANDLLNYIPLPPPVFEEELDSNDDSESFSCQDIENDCPIHGNDDGFLGEQDKSDINTEQ